MLPGSSIFAREIRSVLFLTYHFPPEVGGIQTRISKYIETLAKKGIRVRVLVAGHEYVAFTRFQEASVVSCPGGMGHFLMNAMILTRNVIQSRADVVHVFTGASTALGVFALSLAKAMRAKPVISFFGREDFAFSGFPSKVLFHLSTNLADSIDVNSNSTEELLPQSLKAKAHVLLGAADESRNTLQPRLQLSGNGGLILFVGRLVERKGVDDLLRAFALLKPSIPLTRLAIVGDGPKRDGLAKLAEQLKISDSVQFKGTLVGTELDEEYSRCTVFVLPSKGVATDPANEGLGLALIEAAMHAKPLIGTRHGGIPEIVKQGENGLLVPSGDPASLAEALTKILTDKGLAQDMGERGFEMARHSFNWEKATNVLLETYA